MRCLSMEQLVWSDWRLRSSWRGGTGKPCYPQWLERRRWDRGLVGCSVTCNTAKSTNHSTLVTCNTTSAHPSDPPYYEGLFHCFQRLEWLQKKEPIPLPPHFSSLRKHVTLTAVHYQQNTCSHLIIQNKSDFATLPHHPQLWFSVPRESRLSTQTPKNDPKEKKFIIFVYSRFSTRAPIHHDATNKEKVLFRN